jgi:enterochelin esterase-like enzyme
MDLKLKSIHIIRKQLMIEDQYIQPEEKYFNLINNFIMKTKLTFICMVVILTITTLGVLAKNAKTFIQKNKLELGANKYELLDTVIGVPIEHLRDKHSCGQLPMAYVHDTLYYQNFDSDSQGFIFQDLWSESFWHVSTTGAYSGQSYWCGIESLGGYDDFWEQTLTSPPISLSGTMSPVLTLMHNFSAEAMSGGYYTGFDAWDALNVRISTDGVNFTVIKPASGLSYSATSAYGFNLRFGKGMGGWTGSSGGWVAASFNMAEYSGHTVWLQFLFGSDQAYSHADDNSLFGWRVDNIKIKDGATTIFEDNAGDAGAAKFVAGGPGGPNPWHLTYNASVSPPRSAGCFDKNSGNYQAGMKAAWVSTPIAINDLPSFTQAMNIDFQYKGNLDPATLNGDINNGITFDCLILDVRCFKNGAWSYWNWMDFTNFIPGNFFGYNESNSNLSADLDVTNLIGSDSLQFRIIVLTQPDGNVVPPARVLIDDFILTSKSGFAGPKFGAFYNRITSVPEQERTAIVDSFMKTIPSFPLIEKKNFVYFLYRGNANTVNVPGDVNNFNAYASPMTRISGTNLWYLQGEFEADARLEYQYCIDGDNPIADPLNPRTIDGGFGPKSIFAMPDYIEPPEIEFYPDIPHGTLSSQTISSTILGNSRTIKIYLPPTYATAVNDSFPVVLFHDGDGYIDLAKANNVLDYLISRDSIRPVIGVFVPWVDRANEYAFDNTTNFESFIIDELMPIIDTQYRTRCDPASRAMVGISFGALIATQICYNHPESFGLCAPFSPAWFPNNRQVYNNIYNGPKKDLKIYLDWGTYEGSIMIDATLLKDKLIEKGYEITWNDWNEGHSWGSWRAHLDIALEYFFPTTDEIDDVRSQISDVGCSIYPNPLKQTTTFTYRLMKPAQVHLQVFNSLRMLVAEPLNEFQRNGEHKVVWNAADLPAGIYYCRLQAGKQISSVKIVKMK